MEKQENKNNENSGEKKDNVQIKKTLTASPDVVGNSDSPNSVEGNKNSPAVEPKNPIQEAKDTLALLTEQNRIMAENLKKAEKISAEMMLSGRSIAGREQTKEEKDIESAREMLKGTGFDEQLFPKKQDGQ